MRYTVTWLPTALDELAVIWNSAVDRQAVADAANAIDRDLARDAHAKGQDFITYRVMDVAPLQVNFTVS
jgi:hypothetical protein